MKIYDISIPINEKTVTWPGDPKISFTSCSSIKNGNSANVSEIKMGAHTGTHIDAPYHFIDSGNTIEAIPLSILIGPAIVLEVNPQEIIRKEDIEQFDLQGASRVLLKTKNSNLWQEKATEFNKDFISLSYDGAQYLIEKGIQLIGIDYLSIESFYKEKGHPVHKLLLENEIVVLEGLNLSEVKPDLYELICLPIKFEGIEGSPVRAILRELR